MAWYAWGPAAFEAAKASDKPILLSVGYAACHWCHVMAHESFEDDQIAALMNALFINIKVDREERPDLDTIYQSAVALLGEQGGWPLTMFLTPEGEPFWGGTYFPPEPRFGRPGFPQVLQGISDVYSQERHKVEKNVAGLQEALTKLSTNQAGGPVPLAVLDQVAERIAGEVDPVFGGVGGAPKFPQPTILKLLWRTWKRSKEPRYREAVELTLTRMSQGGIYDHLGGGFARYAVDNEWLVPHFEKMLYDNAQMLTLLTWAWQDTGNPLYAARARETVDWLLREMPAFADDSGRTRVAGFASSYDADSEGEEGKFYVWQETEIDSLLGEAAPAFKAAFDVTPGGNWEGNTILNRSQRPALGSVEEEAALTESRATLLAVRAKRVWPGWDDKVLADWNGLMITALAQAAPVFGERTWLDAAEAAFRFIQDEMVEDGRLKHSWRRGRLLHPATLDDYANLAEAAVALYEATGDSSYLAQAEAWLETTETRYKDPEGGGYFLTADDTEQLIVRTKAIYDNAVPAGNGTLLQVMASLFYLTGKALYRDRAEALVGAFSGTLERNFFPLSTFLNGCEMLQSALQLVILGRIDAEDTQALLAEVHSRSLPNRLLSILADTAALDEGHPAKGKTIKDGQATAFLCRGTTCSLPITAPAELAAALDAG